MISRAANRTSSERSSSTSLRPAISALSFSRVRSDAGILSIGVLLCGGRSPNRTSLVRLIRRRCTPTLFPASLGLHLLKRSTLRAASDGLYLLRRCVRGRGSAHLLSLGLGAAPAFSGAGADKIALHVRQSAQHGSP